jgi:hypothetical protein
MAQTQQELDIIAERKRGEEEGAKPEGRASLDIKSAPVKMPTRPGQQPMVTMDMVKAKGFDNLRDYLNDQKGLTRRGDKPADKPAEKSYENKAKFDPAFFSENPLAYSRTKTTNREKMADLGKKYAKGGAVSSKPKASSASSRGDGIAQRGKTKGRFI